MNEIVRKDSLFM